MKILITGGAGYIGSITNQFLVNLGDETVIFDNLRTGHKFAVGNSPFIVGDLRNKEDIMAVFEKGPFDAVIHFASLTLVPESLQNPYEYYVNNIVGGLNLLEAMRTHDCKRIIFSSTCAVYGHPEKIPVTEDSRINPESVYGSSKRMFEEILIWYEKIYGIRYGILRYFNASGASLDGSLGEMHTPETHIIPIALDVASGKRAQFELYGSDYDTPDGTCIRDYIHVLDLASAHKLAASYITKNDTSVILNLGVGKGWSNKEVLLKVEKVTGKKMTIVNKPRRRGDPDSIFADNSNAKKLLSWEPKYSDLETIISSAWAWYKSHV